MRAAIAFALAAVLVGTVAYAASPVPAPVTIGIHEMAFDPAPKGLRVGQTIVWENRDIFQHSATDRAGGFDVVLKPGARQRITLTREGKISVYCRYHPGMTMTMEVAK